MTKKHYPREKLVFILLYGTTLLLGNTVAWGEFGVTPMLLSLETDPDTTLRSAIHVYSTLPQIPEVEIRPAHLKERNEGPWVLAEPILEQEKQPNRSCRDWISVPHYPFESAHVTTHSGWITVPIEIQVPPDANGMYHTALLVRNFSLKRHNGIRIGTGLVVPIFVRVTGSTYPFEPRLEQSQPGDGFETTSAKISTPPAIFPESNIEADVPHVTWIGSLHPHIATNFRADLSISTEAMSAAEGDWNTSGFPDEVLGYSPLDLDVVGHNVKFENILPAKSKFALARVWIQLLPKFQWDYAANRLPETTSGTQGAGDRLQVLAQWAELERTKMQDVLDQLKRVYYDTRTQRRWIQQIKEDPMAREQQISQNLAIPTNPDQIAENLKQFQKDLHDLHAMSGALYNAELWLGWEIASHSSVVMDPHIRTWLHTEALPWIVSYLGQVQHWVQQPDVTKWKQNIEKRTFLAILSGRTRISPAPDMPSITGISLLPALPPNEPDVVSSALPQELSTPKPEPLGFVIEGDLRPAIIDLSEYTGTLIITDPGVVDAIINLDLRNTSLERSLDLISLSANAIWEKHSGYYLIKPCPIGTMTCPYPFLETETQAARNQEPTINNLYSGSFHMVIQDLALDAEANIVVHPEAAKGIVHLDFSSGIPLEVALDIVCFNTGNIWKKAPDFYFIAPDQGVALDLPYTVTDSHVRSSDPCQPIVDSYWEREGLAGILEDISSQTNHIFIVDPTINKFQKLSASIQELPLETTLDALCLATNCIWQKTPYYYWIKPRRHVPLALPYPFLTTNSATAHPKHIRIEHAGEAVNLSDALLSIAHDTGVSIVFDSRVQHPQTVKIEELSLDAALNKICAQTGTQYQKTPHYYVVTRKGQP